MSTAMNEIIKWSALGALMCVIFVKFLERGLPSFIAARENAPKVENSHHFAENETVNDPANEDESNDQDDTDSNNVSEEAAEDTQQKNTTSQRKSKLTYEQQLEGLDDEYDYE